MAAQLNETDSQISQLAITKVSFELQDQALLCDDDEASITLAEDEMAWNEERGITALGYSLELRLLLTHEDGSSLASAAIRANCALLSQRRKTAKVARTMRAQAIEACIGQIRAELLRASLAAGFERGIILPPISADAVVAELAGASQN